MIADDMGDTAEGPKGQIVVCLGGPSDSWTYVIANVKEQV